VSSPKPFSANGLLNRNPIRKLWPYLLLLLCVVIFFWDSIFAGRVFVMRDIFCGMLAWPQFAQRTMPTGEWAPLWNPFWGFGKPYIADPETAFFYPLNSIYYWFRPPLALTLFCATHLYIAGASIYALARHWRMNVGAALLAAVSFMFSTWMVAMMEFRAPFPTFAWGPLELLVVSHLIERWRAREAGVAVFGHLWKHAGHVAILALLIALQYSAGNPERMFQTLLLVTGFAAARCIWLREIRALIACVCAVALAGIVALCLAMPQFLLAWEFIGKSERSQVIDPGLDMASMHPAHLLTLLLPFLYGRAGYPHEYWARTIYEFWAGTCYVGIPAIIALTFSPLALRRTQAANQESKTAELHRFLFWFFLGIALFALLMAAGKYTPFYMLVYNCVPGFGHFRWPTKFLSLLLYALTMLAALGCHSLSQTLGNEKRAVWIPRLFIGWGVLLALALLGWLVAGGDAGFYSALTGGAFLNTPAHLSATQSDYSTFIIFLALSVASLGALWRFRAHTGRLAPVVALIAFANLFVISRQIHPLQRDDIYEAVPAVAAKVSTPTQPSRLHTNYSSVGQFLYGNKDRAAWLWAKEAGTNSTLVPFRVFQTYQDGLKLERYLVLLSVLNQLPPQQANRLADLMNVRYIIAGAPAEQVLWGGAPREVSVLERPSAQPRAFVVEQWRTVSDMQHGLQAMFNAQFDPAREAVIEIPDGAGPPPIPNFDATPPTPQTAPVDSIHYKWNEVALDVTASRKSLLVLTDSWYPGWLATVDGQPQPIFRADLNFRGVFLESGMHRVQFIYRPWQFRAGLVVSAATALIFLLALGLRYRLELAHCLRRP